MGDDLTTAMASRTLLALSLLVAVACASYSRDSQNATISDSQNATGIKQFFLPDDPDPSVSRHCNDVTADTSEVSAVTSLQCRETLGSGSSGRKNCLMPVAFWESEIVAF